MEELKTMVKKASGALWFIAILLAVLVIGGGLYMFGGFQATGLGGLGGDGSDGSDGTGTNLGAECPDDGQTAITLSLYNSYNTTAAELYGGEYTIKGDEGFYTAGTDMGSASVSVNCGERMTLTVEGNATQNGQTSMITDVVTGIGAVANSDGTVTFTPTKDTYDLAVQAPQKGVLEWKVYDNEDARFTYNNQTATQTWRTTGVSFSDGAANTSFALTNDGDALDFRVDTRTTRVDTEFCDMGCLVAMDFPTTLDTPIVSWEGQTLENYKSSLNPKEQILLANYEYVYLINDEIVRSPKSLDFYVEANSDVALANLSVDWYARTKADSITPRSLIVGTAASDASPPTALITLQRSYIKVS